MTLRYGFYKTRTVLRAKEMQNRQDGQECAPPRGNFQTTLLLVLHSELVYLYQPTRHIDF